MPEPDLALSVVLPPDQFEALTQRVAAVLADGRDDGFLATDGAAEYLGITRKTVYALVERGRLPHHRPAGRLLCTPAARTTLSTATRTTPSCGRANFGRRRRAVRSPPPRAGRPSARSPRSTSSRSSGSGRGTRKTYGSTLDRILIPRFGDTKIGALTVRDVRLLAIRP